MQSVCIKCAHTTLSCHPCDVKTGPHRETGYKYVGGSSSSSTVLWPRASGLTESVAVCTGEAEAGSGPPQLMKQGNIPCNHSIYSECWHKGGWRAGNLVKYEEKLGQASIKD